MEIIARLPNDLRLRILPYTYRLQCSFLLRDIKDYTETKHDLFELYTYYYRDWLYNDMIAYANHYKATMYGFVETFYSIFKRNIRLNTKESVDAYLKKISKKNVNTQINILLGLFNIHERTDLLTDLYTQELYFDEW